MLFRPFFASRFFVSRSAIYPIDRASIRAGSKFDFKVEFDAMSKAADMRITVNGIDYAQALRGKPLFVEKRLFSGKKSAFSPLSHAPPPPS